MEKTEMIAKNKVEFKANTVPKKWGVSVDGVFRNLNIVANFGTKLPEATDAEIAIATALEPFKQKEKFVLLAKAMQDLLRGEL
jgi:hypothetical protein